MDDAELIAQAEMSPCQGVCKSDEITGWCFGCGRTDEEIKDWQEYEDDFKDGLVEPLKERVKTLIARRKAERGGGKSGGRRGRGRAAKA